MGESKIIPSKSTPTNDVDTGDSVSSPPPLSVLHKPSLVCIMLLGFIANVEYGVIMPSVWEYLRSVGGTKAQLGLCLSMSSLTQVIFLPIFGLWSDKRTMKEAICFALTIGIVGNVIYAMAGWGGSPWFIIMGRALVGMYSGCTSVTTSYISFVTTPEERTRFMARVNGINAIGLVSGPAFNLFLEKIRFRLGHAFDVNPLTCPGWFIGLWLCLAFIGYLIVFKEPVHPHHDATKENHSKRVYLRFLLSSFTKPYAACFLVTFVQNFDFSVIETIATPFTKEAYDFHTFQNSLMYSAISVEMIIVIIVTAVATKFVDDRIILLTAQIFMGTGVILGFLFLTPHLKFYMFAVIITVLVMGLPSQDTTIYGIYTKLLTAEFGQAKQGLYSGVMMVFGSSARILGPLWGGSAPSYQVLFVVLTAMWTMELLVVIFFFRQLKPKPQVKDLPVNYTETDPLLPKKPDVV